MQVWQVKAKRNSDSCYVIIDGEEYIINTDIILKYAIAKGRELSQDEYNLIMQEADIINCKKAAYSYASYKPRSEYQIIQRLRLAKYPDEYITTAVCFLKNFDLIDDERFAKNYILHIAKAKKFGLSRIKLELKRLGISEFIIEDALRENLDDDSQLEQALLAYRKKMKALSNKPPEKQKNSIINHLLMKGFSYEIIKKCIESDLEN